MNEDDDGGSSVSSGADQDSMGADQETTEVVTDDSGIDSITVSPSVEEEGVLKTLLEQEDQGMTQCSNDDVTLTPNVMSENKRNAKRSFLHHDSYAGLWHGTQQQQRRDDTKERLASVDLDSSSDNSSDNSHDEPGNNDHCALWSKPFSFPLSKQQSFSYVYTRHYEINLVQLSLH